MGHLRLGRLPGYPNWQRVVETLADPAEGLQEVVAETADAARAELRSSANRPYVWYPYWLLIHLARHAREPVAFERVLHQQGIELGDEESAVALVSALTQALQDQRDGFGPPTAIDELALDAFQKTVGEIVLSGAYSLFGTTTDDVRRAFAHFAPRRAFGKLSGVYLGALYGRVLRYFLSFELGNHVGPNERFESLDDAEDFSRSLERYVRRASELVEEFAEGWYSKQLWEEEEISQDAVRRFLHVALRKFQQQLELETE